MGYNKGYVVILALAMCDNSGKYLNSIAYSVKIFFMKMVSHDFTWSAQCEISSGLFLTGYECFFLHRLELSTQILSDNIISSQKLSNII